MEIEPLGECAFLIRNLDLPAFVVANALNDRLPLGLLEAVASYETVAVYIQPERFDLGLLISEIKLISSESIVSQGRLHTIPVCYELGPDLDAASVELAISPDELISLHTSQPYECFAIGFSPGFPYLGYLPARMSELARRPTPRTRVEPGSVAITGRQTAIYPSASPGGWWLVGRTPLVIVDVEDDFFPIRAGDQVRFERINRALFNELEGVRL